MSDPRPALPALQAAFAQGVEDGLVTLPRCTQCHRFMPTWLNHCTDHWDAPIRIEAAASTGRVWSWVVYHYAAELPIDVTVPYTVVEVDLDDGGPRLYGVLGPEPASTPSRGLRVALDAPATSANGYLTFGPVDDVNNATVG